MTYDHDAIDRSGYPYNVNPLVRPCKVSAKEAEFVEHLRSGLTPDQAASVSKCPKFLGLSAASMFPMGVPPSWIIRVDGDDTTKYEVK